MTFSTFGDSCLMDSVNQSAPSGPETIVTGSLCGSGIGRLYIGRETALEVDHDRQSTSCQPQYRSTGNG